MFLSAYRRSTWRRATRISVVTCVALIFLDIFRLLGAHRTFTSNLLASTVQHYEDLPVPLRNQKIFVTAQFWTSEYILAHHWINALLRLVTVLGPQNVYVSILESGSLDNTADAVRFLDAKLGELNVPRTVVLDPSTHGDAIAVGPIDERGRPRDGWIHTYDYTSTTPTAPPDQIELRRVPYLAALRNKALDPMRRIYARTGLTYDRILHLNDVVFEPQDILTLLATNNGHFDAACGLDFHYPPAIYDTFALRDLSFTGPVMHNFPYFGDSRSRNAMLAGFPAPVSSCWNGVIAVDAAPYYDPDFLGKGKALQFRGTPDSLATYFLEGSECCLIHADLLASGKARKGIFVNPAVRTGYEVDAYEKTHTGVTKTEFVTAWNYILGTWWSRYARWKVDGVSASAGFNMKGVYDRIKTWRDEGQALGEKREEVGGYCTVTEMHILIWNGWKHVWRDVGKQRMKAAKEVIKKHS